MLIALLVVCRASYSVKLFGAVYSHIHKCEQTDAIRTYKSADIIQRSALSLRNCGQIWRYVSANVVGWYSHIHFKIINVSKYGYNRPIVCTKSHLGYLKLLHILISCQNKLSKFREISLICGFGGKNWEKKRTAVGREWKTLWETSTS